MQPAWFEIAWSLPVVAVLGLVVGSFLNVVISRLPVMLERQWRAECAELMEQGEASDPTAADKSYNLIHPRSRCPSCGEAIRARDNIPLVSWFALRGRCRRCGTPISVQYPLVELASALLAVVVLVELGPGWPAAAAIVFSWMLLAGAVIDLRTTLLPDDITLPLLWLGLLASVAGLGFATPVDAIIGAALGYGLLWGLYQVFRLLTGKEGMGYGDFKLLAALGAWTGWQGLPVTILLSSAVGAGVGIAMIALQGRDRAAPIPFGPFLAAGGWIALLWGDALTQAYLAWSLS